MIAGVPELIVVLVIVAVFFGAGKLPQVMGALGSGVKEFRASLDEPDDDDDGKA